VARLHPLPVGHLRRRLVLLRPDHRTAAQTGRQLVPDVLLQRRADVRFLREVTLRPGVPAAAAHVYQVRQRLRPGRALVEIRSLSPERVRGHDSLRPEASVANRAAKFDLLERGHTEVPLQRCYAVLCQTRTEHKGNFVPRFGDDRPCSRFRVRLSCPVRRARSAGARGAAVPSAPPPTTGPCSREARRPERRSRPPRPEWARPVPPRAGGTHLSLPRFGRRC
jgi:hypothetical protein